MKRAIKGLVVVLASVAVLHSGKTDSRGGHFNHSTGEYHYHHGYSAHDHYDMDGDGIVDCPYTFKDNTNSKNGTSKSESNTNNKQKSSNNKKQRNTARTIADDMLRFVAAAVLVYGSFAWLPWAIKTVFEKYKNRK